MDWTLLITIQAQLFVLILVRVSTLVMAIPIVGNRSVPLQLQIGLAGILSLLLWSSIAPNAPPLPSSVSGYGLLVIRELLIGIVIGLATTVIFNAIYLAGQMIDIQMGFGIVNIIDPLSNAPIPIAGQFQYLIAILIFLAIRGHYWFLQAILDSYRLIPLGEVHLSSETIRVLWEFARQMWLIAFKIAAPVLGMLFLSTVAMGIVARTVPQMNVFIVGFPLQIALGIFMLAVVLPIFYIVLDKSFAFMFEGIGALLESMGPPG